MSRRILIAPDKFKGSLTAGEATEAITAGILAREPDAEIAKCPITDGGEGFMEALFSALPSRWIPCPAHDAYGHPIATRYLLADTAAGRTAILEMAEASGIWRIAPESRDPRFASTFGTGEQMRHAIEQHGAERIILGLGGSATNDGGMGMAMALGVEFLDDHGAPVTPMTDSLQRVARINASKRIPLPEIIAACDVENPLLGPNGSTAVFSAQKGSTEATRPLLEAALARLVELSDGEIHSQIPGAGAAGGLGFGLLHFAGAKLVPGFDLIADLLGLEQEIRSAHLVITGEGSLDAQSLSGKGPVALARMARRFGVPVVGVCGMADDAVRESGLFDSIHALADTGLPLEELLADAARHLTSLVSEATLP